MNAQFTKLGKEVQPTFGHLILDQEKKQQNGF